MNFDDLVAIVDRDVGIDALVVGDRVRSCLPDNVVLAGGGVLEMSKPIVQRRDAGVPALVSESDPSESVHADGGVVAVTEDLVCAVPRNGLVDRARRVDLADRVPDLRNDLPSGRAHKDDVAFPGDSDGRPCASGFEAVTRSPTDDDSGARPGYLAGVVPHGAVVLALVKFDDEVAHRRDGDGGLLAPVIVERAGPAKKIRCQILCKRVHAEENDADCDQGAKGKLVSHG